MITHSDCGRNKREQYTYIASVPLIIANAVGNSVIKYQYGYSYVLGYGSESCLRFCTFSHLLAILPNHPHMTTRIRFFSTVVRGMIQSFYSSSDSI